MVLSETMEETEVTWILYLAFFIHSRKTSISFGTPYLLKCSFALLPSFSSATPKQAKHNSSHLTPPSKKKSSKKKLTQIQENKPNMPQEPSTFLSLFFIIE